MAFLEFAKCSGFGGWTIVIVPIILFPEVFFQDRDQKKLWSAEYLYISIYISIYIYIYMYIAITCCNSPFLNCLSHVSFQNIFFETLVKLHHQAALGNCCWASCSLAATESIQVSSVDIHSSLVYIGDLKNTINSLHWNSNWMQFGERMHKSHVSKLFCWISFGWSDHTDPVTGKKVSPQTFSEMWLRILTWNIKKDD